jgi:hypothetical protein
VAIGTSQHVQKKDRKISRQGKYGRGRKKSEGVDKSNIDANKRQHL